jgi:SAM-dependent methyltransferase
MRERGCSRDGVRNMLVKHATSRRRMTMGSATVQGPLWGAKAALWAELAEPSQEPFYRAAFDALGVADGTRLLDVGCGAGLALTLAARRGATVAGLDAAEELVAIARTRLPDADIRVGELEDLPFPDNSFTAATSFNAVQYAADPCHALVELGRVAEPGAPIAIVTWGDPARSEMRDVLAAIGALLPPPPPGAGGPFALSQPGALEELVESAGLTPREADEVPTRYEYPDVETAVLAQTSSGPAVRAAQHAGAEAVSRALHDVMNRYRKPNGSVRLDNVFRYLVATA